MQYHECEEKTQKLLKKYEKSVKISSLHNRIKECPRGKYFAKRCFSFFSHTLRERLCSNYALLRKEGKHFFCAPSGAQFCF